MTAISENMAEALPDLERVREARAKLSEAGVRYVLSCWIDLLGVPKTKPVPLSDFENLCMGKGPQFAVHSVSFVPELTPADSDQIPVPDLDSLVICPWDRTCAWMIAGSVVGRRAVQFVSTPGAQARRARRRREGFCRIRGYRAGVHRHALARGPTGQGLRRRSASRRRRAAQAAGVRLRRRVLHRLHGVPRLAHRHPGGARLGVEGRGRGRRLLAVRTRLRLHGRPADGRPPGVSARAVEGGGQEAWHVHHLHAQAHRRRLAVGRAHQLLDAVGRCPRGEPVQGRRRQVGVRRGVQRGRRVAAPRRCAYRHRLPDGQFLQRPGAPGRRLRRQAP